MELHIPADWTAVGEEVRIECSCFLRRMRDKRWQGTPAKQAFLSASCSVFLPGQLSLLWYHLPDCGRHFITNRKIHRPYPFEVEKAAPLPKKKVLDRITVKDGSQFTSSKWKTYYTSIGLWGLRNPGDIRRRVHQGTDHEKLRDTFASR